MCFHPPPKAEVTGSSPVECANLFNDLENFLNFF